MIPSRFASARALADLVAAGEVSALELADAHIARIEREDTQINAVVVRRFEQAREEARAIDVARAAGHALPPLAGVPITVKECFDLEGTASTFGHPARADHRPSRDALTVARLRRAGAVILGKTNVPRDLADWQSFNDLYGTTRNPWNPDRSPGGSSGGASAALAAGFSALELGSDIGGSIRVPAHYCGVYGHKPTFGIVPVAGHAMIEDEPAADLNVAGPLARSAGDLALALGLLAGNDPDDPWQLQLPAAPADVPRGLRIAVLTGDPGYPVDRATRTAALSVAAALRSAGATVSLDPALPLDSDRYRSLYIAMLRGSTSARLPLTAMPGLHEQAQAVTAADDGYDAQRLRGLTQSHREWHERNLERTQLQARWAAFFREHDALIAPITTTCAFEHTHSTPKHEQMQDIDGKARPATDNYFWIGLPTLPLLPATAMPATLSTSGLPIGLQVIGPAFSDLRGIAIAAWLERHHRGFVPPPGR
jgi:amidase